MRPGRPPASRRRSARSGDPAHARSYEVEVPELEVRAGRDRQGRIERLPEQGERARASADSPRRQYRRRCHGGGAATRTGPPAAAPAARSSGPSTAATTPSARGGRRPRSRRPRAACRAPASRRSASSARPHLGAPGRRRLRPSAARRRTARPYSRGRVLAGRAAAGPDAQRRELPPPEPADEHRAEAGVGTTKSSRTPSLRARSSFSASSSPKIPWPRNAGIGREPDRHPDLDRRRLRSPCAGS